MGGVGGCLEDDSSFEEKEKHQSSFLRVLTRFYPQSRARQLLLSAACLT